jgi:hypothetical protein
MRVVPERNQPNQLNQGKLLKEQRNQKNQLKDILKDILKQKTLLKEQKRTN